MTLPADKDWVVYRKDNPREHWEGRRYPEWELVKMGEADNTPGDPFDVDWESNDIKEVEEQTNA